MDEVILKYVLVGESGVGKTSLVKRLCNNEWNSHESTIGVQWNNWSTTVENRNLRLQIWDMGGGEQFRDSMKQFFQGTTAVILVFDLCDRRSFEKIEGWIREIETSVNNPWLITCLVGNKRDQADSESVVYNGKRAISEAEAQQYADSRSLLYFETSAKSGRNVEAPFRVLATRVIEAVHDGTIDFSASHMHGIRPAPLRMTNRVIDNTSVQMVQCPGFLSMCNPVVRACVDGPT